ncbi:unnamed protein product [Vitrella brassicaformis CCMP3155]|uniref:Uncharacterized protein n=1 Tax=Vitrella brassicaformis (strain CCMP3155) TaxID=1169540 RepID=A0A0G4EEK6_VITBC|nr:unnamed protein product [Vitrella brassicaformis CCMP3155]|eukprot:CEL93812.1 unnamed protein product [Vitrella brassicaformis CCMP3155]
MFLQSLLLLVLIPMTCLAWVGINFSDSFTSNPLSLWQAMEVLRLAGIRKIKFFEIDFVRLDTVVVVFGCNVRMLVSNENDKLEAFAYGRRGERGSAYEMVKSLEPYGELIEYVAVGNEPLLPYHAELNGPFLAPAFRNVAEALRDTGERSARRGRGRYRLPAKPTVPFSASILDNTIWDTYYNTTLRPILDIIQREESKWCFNIYPWFADRKYYPLSYAVYGQPEDARTYAWGNGAVNCTAYFRTDPATGLPECLYFHHFDELFDLQVYLHRLGNWSVDLIIGETGWPTGAAKDATLPVAQAYLEQMVRRSDASVARGTPLRPNVKTSMYLFEAFDEDIKYEMNGGSYSEDHFGLFTKYGAFKFPSLNLPSPDLTSPEDAEVPLRRFDDITDHSEVDWRCPCSVDCQATVPPFGRVTVGRESKTNGTVFLTGWGERVEFSCVAGYILEGPSQAVCWAFGKFKAIEGAKGRMLGGRVLDRDEYVCWGDGWAEGVGLFECLTEGQVAQREEEELYRMCEERPSACVY